ncbi:MAG TPA: M20/M25/M40 family metallo-hydrolase [Thermoanaerobaculia bacterium]|nr:M20/M25/M40 family metallo-hydrolase [Thermoanaerobaculia bacterium]
MRRLLLLLAFTFTFAVSAQDPRPAFTIGANAVPFDAAQIAPYTGAHPKIYAYIDAHREQHLANVRRWLRQRSISAQNDGIREMATMLRDDLKKIGFHEAEIAETSGHPGVFGYLDAGAPKTLLVYMMYDVQPVEPEAWHVKPFDAALVDHELGRVLMARGAVNQKGPQRAFLNAIESILAVDKKLPVNLMVLAEGEEELGSPHMPELIAKYEQRLRTASGVVFPFPSQDRTGAVTLNLGVKGILYFELEAKGGDRGGPVGAEVHGSTKALIDSPALRLIQALSTLTSRDGNTIAIPGYYDAIRPPNAEEQSLYKAMLPSFTAREAGMKQSLDVRRWIENWGGEKALLQYLHNTTLNVDGIWSGYTGPGTKTILPHKATAKVDSRLVPDQTPEEALRLIREHLDRNGFADLEIRRLGGYPPAQSSVTAPLIRTAIGVYNKYGLTPSVSPRLAGSAPYYLFTERLGLPMLAGGIGIGSGAHAPDEYLLVEAKPGSKLAGLAESEKFFVDLVFALK